jgi:hypothetical protein
LVSRFQVFRRCSRIEFMRGFSLEVTLQRWIAYKLSETRVEIQVPV